MELDQILVAAEDMSLKFRELHSFAHSVNLSLLSCCDMLALHVAREYANGQLPFESCDSMMNTLFSLATSTEFWAMTGNETPSILFAVYQAFDEGEYFHQIDNLDANPEAKYTQPLIASILEQHQSAQEN